VNNESDERLTSATVPGPRPATYDLATAQHDYPLWDGPPQRTILLCTHQRSGSTLLGEALHFAGGLGCPLEYFHGGFRPALAARWHAPNIGDYAARLFAHRTDPSGTLSIKLFWRDMVDLATELDPSRFSDLGQLAPEATTAETYRALADLLGPLWPRPVYLHLSRRDRIRQAISIIAASDTGRWRLIPDVDERPPAGEPQFDLDRIERLIAYSDVCHGHWRNFFAAIGATPYQLSYEDLAGNYPEAVTGALRFLGSDALPPPVRMRRQADQGSEARVLQFLRERAAAARAAS
jgi:LPS sulfotransferase NodH